MLKLVMFWGNIPASLTSVLFPDLDIALLFSLDMGVGLTQISVCLREMN